MAFLTAYHTDVGIKKKTNQDGLLIKTAATPLGQVGVFVVCDGMGGLSHGELASATVIRGLSQWFDNDLPSLLRTYIEQAGQKEVTSGSMLAGNQPSSGSTNRLTEEIQTALEVTIKQLNEKILQYGERQNVKLGTTLTALIIINHTYTIAHVGDSRVYCIAQHSGAEPNSLEEETQLLQEARQPQQHEETPSQQQPATKLQPSQLEAISHQQQPAVLTLDRPETAVTQLTTDQTLVAREVARGNITVEQAKIDPRRNVLLQCVGATNEIEVEFYTGESLPHSIFVLCSDGFCHEISDDELKVHFSKKDLQLKAKIVELVDLVKARGEVDNISVVAVKVP
ncbi:PP2C family protein-serine/threonine phosphatase [Neobacillus kokaensis]|uniref:PPM-type phosphatase domain-containing protein n=1 Tax=Neobacillus kokaensis TaxID=2759023 RepID=A0ABQ3N547_9BACI|nr:protein phosphatase 2C domain-containing protein [Neobacillus kokaensis]GHH98737.1 hypothetical protein AM1BK_22800 [Neobacillus kokaensis]